jgi:hypothetical protein
MRPWRYGSWTHIIASVPAVSMANWVAALRARFEQAIAPLVALRDR